MNGVHDMGGMQCMGPVVSEQDEPVFHATWEGRIQAIYFSLNARRKWTIDTVRLERNQIPPVDYLRNSYYENTFAEVVSLAIKQGLITADEVATGRPAPGSSQFTPVLRPDAVLGLLARGTVASRDVPVQARFKIGDAIRARNLNPTGHTRLPRYARGKSGIVERDQGVYVFPDTNAHFLGEKPQHVYGVRFTARELWGDDASPADSVHIDLYEDYLAPA